MPDREMKFSTRCCCTRVFVKLHQMRSRKFQLTMNQVIGFDRNNLFTQNSLLMNTVRQRSRKWLIPWIESVLQRYLLNMQLWISYFDVKFYLFKNASHLCDFLCHIALSHTALPWINSFYELKMLLMCWVYAMHKCYNNIMSVLKIEFLVIVSLCSSRHDFSAYSID